MAAARGLRTRYVLFGAYPRRRDGEAWRRGLRQRILKAHGGVELDSWETSQVWGERFFPVELSRPTPEVVREYVPLEDLRRALEDRPRAAFQCTISRSREALLLVLGAESAAPRARSRG